MIPQRNISLLSNRLAAGGGLRIREDVLERDYCLAWFLNAMAESDLRPVLAFKGGTALKRCYFAEPTIASRKILTSLFAKRFRSKKFVRVSIPSAPQSDNNRASSSPSTGKTSACALTPTRFTSDIPDRFPGTIT